MKTVTVMAFGTFDVLHPGHLLYLSDAKKLGDRLIVVVARDESVRMMKKRNPVFGESARLRIVRSLKMVDRAVLGNKLKKPSDIYNIFKTYKPDVIALGYDQKANVPAMKEWLAKNSIKARIVRLRTNSEYKAFKSSKLIPKL